MISTDVMQNNVQLYSHTPYKDAMCIVTHVY
jgi:hypothetical protein